MKAVFEAVEGVANKEVSISLFLSLAVLEHATKRIDGIAKKAIILSFIFFI